ncbi:MAG: Nitrilotriacetate monooxygenase component A [Paracidovorax wautersii]|uniref:Nitrilotriacetate monooxygenase component A n=1 Tax=Paracidovorax wautersii TaxID=1177982 RepID=A0A7V8JRU8_9BURK|nr:MAG: Nitrilotriacetate monooxygenase component A [Paracidovorax wautersii]
MTAAPQTRRLKTLVGAASFVSTPSDESPRTAGRRAAELARSAEAARITGLFTADLLQADPNGLSGTTGTQEPIVALAALSQATERIGLVATVSTTFFEPYNLARLIGTLDHVSGGRAAWNAVTSSVGEENFGGDLPGPEARYARAEEFVAAFHALFDANDPKAARRTASGGLAVDPSRLHRIDFHGEHVRIQGPLNVPPPPQGRPVQFQAGQSEQGVTLGARFAEFVYTSQPTLAQAQAFVADLHRRARAFGREGDHLPRVMNSFHSVIGESDADVARRVRERDERVDYDKGRLQLADMLGGSLDLSELPLDKPLPASLLPDVDSSNRRRGRVEIFRRYAEQGLTLRELILQARETGHWFVAGTPEKLADAIEERWNAGVLDIISLHGLGQPDQESLLLGGLLPELRRRRLIDEDYVGETFRANLELPPLR